MSEEMKFEIELIQSCITRMANNSFLIKGWMITIIAGFIALTADTFSITTITLFSILFISLFWYLDAFFVRTEQLYRKKNNWVIQQRPLGNKDFWMDLNPKNKDMWLNYDKKEIHILKVMFSQTLILFYCIPLVISIGLLCSCL